MIIDIIAWAFLILIALLFGIGYFYDNFRCKHEWEEVIRNSTGVIYRCKKCGKEKRYEI